MENICYIKQIKPTPVTNKTNQKYIFINTYLSKTVPKKPIKKSDKNISIIFRRRQMWLCLSEHATLTISTQWKTQMLRFESKKKFLNENIIQKKVNIQLNYIEVNVAQSFVV